MMKKLFLDTHSASGEIKLTDGLLYWFPQFLTPIQADQAFQQMLTHLDWQQKSIACFNRDLSLGMEKKATVIQVSLYLLNPSRHRCLL
ncbi:Alkylated DNA repair protein [Vibrio cholerae]|nr:Alkylated DNA repair protein [Vibrio cholerae]CSC20662.1 Alkylated DNA repair protein [Vibrio cholerae]CSC33670.1 Alkylated DNA repair protein [Vibrio cholerae]CSC65394.1 Alkylated DNA repair protein [Vibrio cholerae]